MASTRVWNFLWQPHRAASWTPKNKNGRLCWKVPVSVLMWGWAHVRRNLNGGQAHVKCQFVEAWGRLWLGKQITVNVDLQGFAEVFHSWRFTFFHLMTTNFKVKETIKKRKQRHALCLWKNCKDQQHRCVMYAKFQGETFRLFFLLVWCAQVHLQYSSLNQNNSCLHRLKRVLGGTVDFTVLRRSWVKILAWAWNWHVHACAWIPSVC